MVDTEIQTANMRRSKSRVSGEIGNRVPTAGDDDRMGIDGRSSKQPPVGTLERGLSLLIALGSEEEGMTLTQIASSVGLPKPTITRLLSTLTEFGFVEQHGRSYRVGYQCFTLAGLYTFDEHLQRRALPVMEELMEEVREVVQLGTLKDDRVLYLERVEPQRSIALVLSQPGSTRPAYCTALGKSLIAHMSLGEQEAYIDRTELRRYTKTTLTKRAELLADLEAVRSRGYAVDDGEVDEEVSCVAAPITAKNGEVVAAMSVSAPRFRISGDRREEVGELVARASKAIYATGSS